MGLSPALRHCATTAPLRGGAPTTAPLRHCATPIYRGGSGAGGAGAEISQRDSGGTARLKMVAP